MPEPQDVSGQIKIYTPTPTIARCMRSDKTFRLLVSGRGEGKSSGSLMTIVTHAQKQPPATWPAKFAALRDTRRNLGLTTAATIKEWFPEGLASFWVGKDLEPEYCQIRLHPEQSPVVEFFFFGCDNPRDYSKFQSFECDGVWMEEPAPAADISGGIPGDALAIAVTSMRKSATPLVIIAENPPDGSDWTAQTWNLPGADLPDWDTQRQDAVERIRAQSDVFLIPKGENHHLDIKTPGYRERNRDMLLALGRADLVKRLVEGQVGTVHLGEPVASNFRQEHIVESVPPVTAGERLISSWDPQHCYSDDTEILTRTGWKFFKNLFDGEQVATRDPVTGTLAYHPIEARICAPFEGELIGWKSQNVDILVTPDHQVPYTRRPDPDTTLWATARALADGSDRHRFVAVTAQWAGEEPPDTGYGPLGWDGVTFAQFMGLYLSEGSVSHQFRNNAVVIYQNHRDVFMETILHATGLLWKWFDYGKTKGWRALNKPLVLYLRSLGKAAEKYIPEDIKNMPPAHIALFIDAYTRGDGMQYTSQIPGRKKQSHYHAIWTSSKWMADDFQELALKVGWTSTLNNVPPKRSIIQEPNGPRVIQNQASYCVYFKKLFQRVELSPEYLYRQPYKGNVYCVRVKHHVICVRRHGRPSWNGNSPACTLWRVRPGGFCDIIASFQGVNMGVRQLIERTIRPWLALYVPEDVTFTHTGDPNTTNQDQSSSAMSAAKAIIELMGGEQWVPGPVSIEDRRLPMHDVLGRYHNGRPWIRIDRRWSRVLIQALEGGWRYGKDTTGRVIKDRWEKNQMSDVGEAFAYGCALLTRRELVLSVQEKWRRKVSQMARDHRVTVVRGTGA
jgi:hypothetical protein